MKTNFTFLRNVISVMLITVTIASAQVDPSQTSITIAGGQSNLGLLETTINGDVDANGDRLNPLLNFGMRLFFLK